MKTLFTIIFIIAVVILITTYTSQKSPTTEVDLLQDVTDRQIAKPDINEIISQYNFENKYNGGIFHLTKLTDVTYNQKTEAKIEPANEWLSNELERNKEISDFKDQVSQIITTADKDSSGRINSSLYLPIANALNELSTKKMQRRILLVYSDLMENTLDMSFYQKENFALLKTNPQKVQDHFEKLEHLNSLSGIEVFLIYQPANNTSDQNYQIVSDFYRKLLEDKGAKVTISANINL
jgi:hypothetical protein